VQNIRGRGRTEQQVFHDLELADNFSALFTTGKCGTILTITRAICQRTGYSSQKQNILMDHLTRRF
jgi:hypothetical protein